MSRGLIIFLSEFVPKEEVLAFVKNDLNGYIIWPDDIKWAEAVLEDREGTIWIKYGYDFEWWKEEIEELKKKFGFDVKTYIRIEVNNADEADLLARNFCVSLMKRFQGSYLHDYKQSFYDLSQLKQIEVTEDHEWKIFWPDCYK